MMQKHFITKILKVWKTISFDKSAFLSGVLPLECVFIRRAAEYWSRRDRKMVKECADLLGVSFNLQLTEKFAKPQEIFTNNNLLSNIPIQLAIAIQLQPVGAFILMVPNLTMVSDVLTPCTKTQRSSMTNPFHWLPIFSDFNNVGMGQSP